MSKFLFLVVVICFLFVGGIWFFLQHDPESKTQQLPPTNIYEPQASPSTDTEGSVELIEEMETQTPEKDLSSIILHDVPFASQAPEGNWDDQRQQDGCEEASIMMAVLWARNEELTTERALHDILALSHKAEDMFGYFQDSNTTDTAQLLEEFYEFTNYELQQNITTDDIEEAIRSNAVVAIPADGRKLANPNFTPPGPDHHMLVVTGYDSTTDEFVTNDPGTRNGESYRYSRATLEDAIADYPTGNHAPRLEETTSMITIYKE